MSSIAELVRSATSDDVLFAFILGLVVGAFFRVAARTLVVVSAFVVVAFLVVMPYL